MSNKLLFKITNSSRIRKVSVTEESESEALRINVIAKASKKLEIIGTQLVLESDGTEVDDDDILKLLHKELLILLEANETWVKSNSFCRESTGSTSTLTISPTPSTSFSSRSDIELGNVEIITTEPSNESPVNLGSVSESTWTSFVIPWHKLKDSTLKSCEDGKTDSRAIRDVIHVVGDHLMTIKQNVPAKAIKLAAAKIIAKYPKTFQDVDDDGIIFGDGSHTVFSKLKEHIKYMNRSHTRRSDSNSPLPSLPLKKKQKMLSAKAGTSNWQPAEPQNDNAEEEGPDQMKKRLKNIDGNNDALAPETIDLLKNTYFHQRTFLNNIPTVLEIKAEWPILLSRQGIYWHYKELMGHDVITLTDQMLAKSEKIIAFAKKQKLLRLTTFDSDDRKLVCIIDIFASYFGENMNHFYSEIKNEELETAIGNSPHIVHFENGNEICVYFEKIKINETSSFREALQQAFALFFNFNLEYPKKMSSTLEMMQRYFLKIHPDVGTKNRKLSSKTKIVSLMNKLRN